MLSRKTAPQKQTKSSLSQSQIKLVELMHQINYGRIENLQISDGKPMFDPPPRVVRKIKFGGKNGPYREAANTDFTLKAQVVDLFCQLERIGNGLIHCLEVKHGLPFAMDIEETHSCHETELHSPTATEKRTLVAS